jgi:hypothetical protein
MGQIIAFNARAKITRRQSEPVAGSAQILFFLGVRYSRIEDEQDVSAMLAPDLHGDQGGGRKRRKRVRA